MTIGVQTGATRLDEGKITEAIIQGGNARKSAVHRPVLDAGHQTWRQYIREDKPALRTVVDPDVSRYKSQFAYTHKDQVVPFIVDRLSYGRFELERINKGVIPYDRQQRDLSMYFQEAEDREFFAGNPNAPAGGSTGFANEGTTVGTHFTVDASTELDLTTDVTMVDTLAKMMGQQLDHFKEAVSDYSLLLAVTPDVDDRINGYKNATTGQRMKPEMLSMLAENGNGGAAVIRTGWLGATVDKGNGNLGYKTADGALGAALMMWSETNPLYEVLETGMIIDSGTDPVGAFEANLTEGYLPVSYDPFSIINSKIVDISS